MLDITAVVIAYAGYRLYEKFVADKPQQKESAAAQQAGQGDTDVTDKMDETAREPEASEAPKDEPPPLDPREIAAKQRRHYQIMTGVTMGTAVLRYMSPAFTLLNVATYAYTMFPFYRRVEHGIREHLIKERRIDSHFLMGAGNLLLLGSGRYITAGIGLGFAYAGDAVAAKASETAEKKLTSNLLDSLFDPHQKVWIIKDGVELETELEAVRQGDLLTIRAGETIPIDGEVVSGMASVDQHAFTGESYPVEKGMGETVFASTLILTGQLQVRVEKSGHDTAIGRIGKILADSLRGKTQTQLRGEELAEKANLPFLAMAGVGLLVSGPVGAMVILSGNTIQAIRLLAPLATINYQSLASHRRILVKQGQCLEQISAIDTFLFDKTGTLTDGELTVNNLHCVHPEYGEKEILFYAALAEHQLTHPIARAIVRYARDTGLDVENLDNIDYRQGFGIVVQYREQTIHVGSARFLETEGIFLSEATLSQQKDIFAQGRSLVMVAIDREVAGLIELGATIRPEVREVFDTLRQKGIKHIGIVSGDHAAPTENLARDLGADYVFAEVLPEDKADIVGQFKSEGRTVCFIGDGVNDAIAMQQADLSISLRGATTLATDVADIILTDPDLHRLTDLLDISSRLEKNLKRSLGICYLGMGTVLLGSVLTKMDILTAMCIHFGLGSTAVGNAMLPLIEMKRDGAGPQTDGPAGSGVSDAGASDEGTSAAGPSHAGITDASGKKPIVIVGAGAAGTACALAAAAQGEDVVLIEQSGQPGGTVAQTLIHTLGGLYDDEGEFVNPGLPVELAERLSQASPHTRKRRIGKTWTLSVDPEVYSEVIREWIAETPGIDIRTHTRITDVSVSDGTIDEITTANGSEHPGTLRPHTVIDTTGNAEVVRLIRRARRGCCGKKQEETAGEDALGGMIIRLRGVTPEAVAFPKSVALLLRIRKAADAGKLPRECASIWMDSGVYPDEVYVKFNLKPADFNTNHMEKVADELLVYLHTVPEFSRAVIDTGGRLGIRDGSHVDGDYTLTETDIKAGRRFPDAVCQACWPIEYWDPERGVNLDHFPPGHRYEIPMGALKVSGVTNLFTAGKCLSAEPRAQASARVVGTCWAMGEGLVHAITKDREN